MTPAFSTVCLAAPRIDSSNVVYSSIAFGKLYHCGPDAMEGDDADRLVAVVTIDLSGSTERTDYVVPVHQHFTRHPFRWRLADDAIFMLTGTGYPVGQNVFAFHRIPLSELPRHRRQNLRLPRREEYTDYGDYQKAWFSAVGAPTVDRKLEPFHGAYAICDPTPVYAAFVREGATKKFSFDFSVSADDSIKCSTYGGGVFEEFASTLEEVKGQTERIDPGLWEAIRSQKIVMEDRFWVFPFDTFRYLVTESGKVLVYNAPEEPRAAGVFDDSPVVCIVDDADSGKVFAFSRRGYCELKDPLTLIAHQLPARAEDQDFASLAARCAQVLMDAGRARSPKSKPGNRDGN
ncbi:MAG TPA: hypothetical protein VJ783_05500 [Pirellulales bacterium]|nr:hypothetical protein [Pirellulales bacterium]